MPSKFKNLVRARMAKTGESWQTAERNVRSSVNTSPINPIANDLVRYEAIVRLLLGLLGDRIPGIAGATRGPGPNVAGRFRVAGTEIVFNAIIYNNTIHAQAVTEPAGGILWGAKENPATAEGAATAVAEMVEWFVNRIDIRTLAAQLSSFGPQTLREALDQVGSHPERGHEKSYEALTGNGQVVDTRPERGVTIRRDGDAIRFRVTFVEGMRFYWDEIVMKAPSFPRFVHAMRDVIRRNTGSDPSEKTRVIDGVRYRVTKPVEGAVVLTEINNPTKVYTLTRRFNGGYNPTPENPPPEVWFALLEEFHDAERVG